MLAPSPANASVQMRLLGAPQIDRAGHPHPLPLTRPGWLLSYLALAGEAVEREHVAALFWPECNAEEAQHHLRITLHRARRLVQQAHLPVTLDADRRRLRFAPATDVHGFRAALTRRDWTQALSLYRQPLCGNALPTAMPALADWVETQRRALASEHRRTVRAQVDDLAQAQRFDEALDVLQPLLAAEPLAEDLHQDHFALLLRAGRRAEALAERDALAARVRLELGTDLLPATVAVFEQAALPAPAPALALSAESTGPATRLPRSALVDALTRAAAAAPALVLVRGEAGAGKSHLLAAAFPAVPTVSCDVHLAQVPYAALAKLLRSLPPAAVPDHLRPALAPLLAPGAVAGGAAPELAKLRLLEAATEAVCTLGPRLAVDDVQWCDRATLEWIGFARSRSPLALLLLARTGEAKAAFSEWWQEIGQDPAVQVIEVPPLTRAEIGALAATDLGAAAARAELLDWIEQQTDGNALLATELVAALRRSPALRKRGTSAHALGDRAQRLLASRLDLLDDAARRMLDGAAVLGDASDLEALAATTGLPLEVIDTQLARAEGLGVMRDARFRHALIRDAVLQRLADTRRRLLHLRAAQALEGRAPPARIAAHFEAAGREEDALPWLLQAGRDAALVGLETDANALFERVLTRAQRPHLRLRAQAALAARLMHSDLPRGHRLLLDVLAHADEIDSAEQRDAVRGAALTGLLENRVYGGDLPEAAQHAETLQPLLPRLPLKQRCDAYESLLEYCLASARFDLARTLLARARAAAPGAAGWLGFEGLLAWRTGRCADALQLLERMLREHPTATHIITVENDIGVMRYWLGDLAGAERAIRAGLVTWRGNHHAEALSMLNLAHVAISQADVEGAHALLDRAEALARSQGSDLFIAEAHQRRARLLLQQDRPAEAAAQLAQALTLQAERGDPMRLAQAHALVAEARVRLGDPAAAEHAAAQAERAAAQSGHPIAQARAHAARALLHLATGQPEAAHAAASAMHAVAQAAQLRELEGDALLLRARADEALGRPADAASQRAAALALAQVPPLPALQQRCQLALAVNGTQH